MSEDPLIDIFCLDNEGLRREKVVGNVPSRIPWNLYFISILLDLTSWDLKQPLN